MYVRILAKAMVSPSIYSESCQVSSHCTNKCPIGFLCPTLLHLAIPLDRTLPLRLHHDALSHRKHPCTCTRLGFLATTRCRVMFLRLHAARKLFQFWRRHSDIIETPWCSAGHDREFF